MNDVPVISSTPVLTATEKSPWSYTVLATDPDNTVLTYSLVTKPEGMTIAGNVISWTPANGVTTSGVVTIRVSDGTASLDQEFTIAVTAVNDVPVVNGSIENKAATTTTVVSLAIPSDLFVDPDGDKLTISAVGMPSGVVFDGTTFSGTPTETGTFEITVTAKDIAGASASTKFTIVVDASVAIKDNGSVKGYFQNGILLFQNPVSIDESAQFIIKAGKDASVKIYVLDVLSNILDEQEGITTFSREDAHKFTWDLRNKQGSKVGSGCSYKIIAKVTDANGQVTMYQTMVGVKK